MLYKLTTFVQECAKTNEEKLTLFFSYFNIKRGRTANHRRIRLIYIYIYIYKFTTKQLNEFCKNRGQYNVLKVNKANQFGISVKKRPNQFSSYGLQCRIQIYSRRRLEITSKFCTNVIHQLWIIMNSFFWEYCISWG